MAGRKNVASDPGAPTPTPTPQLGLEASCIQMGQNDVSSISAIGERRRALQLLARSPTGCTETLMLAHGFSTEVLERLVVDGFAIAQRGVMLAGYRRLTVMWMEITDLGHVAICDTIKDDDSARSRPEALN